jgi:hypothetical protein
MRDTTTTPSLDKKLSFSASTAISIGVPAWKIRAFPAPDWLPIGQAGCSEISTMKFTKFALLLVAPVLLVGTAVFGQQFTWQIGSPPQPPTPLVNHSDTWFYHKGTNEPLTNWQSVADATIATTAGWATAPGGFGFGDPGIATNGPNYESTTLNDMLNGYSTLYIRKTFNVPSQIDTNLHLLLKLDYDDGFVGYLDGSEIRRSPNAPGPVGSYIPYTTNSLAPNHEASCCENPVNPPSVFDLGAAGTKLQPGDHVFAIIGLNASRGSSDFHLIPDLSLSGDSSSTVSGTHFTLVTADSVLISGTNIVPGSTRVVINGDDATFNSSSGQWSRSQPLAPGVNKLFIAALDALGAILYSTNVTVISEISSTDVSGVLPANSVWNSSMGIIHVTANATVPVGGSLRIEDGAVVLLGAGVSIQAPNASLTVTGTYAAPIYFLPANGSTLWGELSASGNSGLLSLQYADLTAGHVDALNGAIVSIQDCNIHDYINGSTPLIHTDNAASLVLRRTHMQRYHELLIRRTPVQIEDCFCEDIVGDGIDFDAAPPGSVIRRCTMRHGNLGNVDAFDLGELSASQFTDGVIVESCLVYDFPFDKGVSLGIARNIIIRSNVISHCNSGVAVKDSSTAYIHNNTFADVEVGLNLYKKPGTATQDGGHATATNNIIWGVTTNVHLDPLSTITVGYTDVQGSPLYPGEANINEDPLFLNAAIRDYRVAQNSPTIGAASDGGDMGAQYPVGGIPAPPLRLAVLASGTALLQLLWVDDSDNEDGFAIERSIDAATWIGVSAVGPGATNYIDSSAVLGQKYYYRVRASNGPGISPLSNVASGLRQAPVEISGISMTGANTVQIQFTAQANTAYTLLYRDSLSTGSWQSLHHFDAALSTQVVTYPDTLPMGVTTRFYRLSVP